MNDSDVCPMLTGALMIFWTLGSAIFTTLSLANSATSTNATTKSRTMPISHKKSFMKNRAAERFFGLAAGFFSFVLTFVFTSSATAAVCCSTSSAAVFFSSSISKLVFIENIRNQNISRFYASNCAISDSVNGRPRRFDRRIASLSL